MANTTKRQKIARDTLYNIGYNYLCDNFHKFSQDNKIKVSLDVMRLLNKNDEKEKPDSTPLIVQLHACAKEFEKSKSTTSG